jgi:hypothetical protein
MDKLKKILEQCKYEVCLTVNRHRDYYQKAEQALEELDSAECPPEIEPEVRQGMIDKNTIIELQFYPDTSVGFYIVYHYDLDAALDEALEVLEQAASSQTW